MNKFFAFKLTTWIAQYPDCLSYLTNYLLNLASTICYCKISFRLNICSRPRQMDYYCMIPACLYYCGILIAVILILVVVVYLFSTANFWKRIFGSNSNSREEGSLSLPTERKIISDHAMLFERVDPKLFYRSKGNLSKGVEHEQLQIMS